MKKYEHYNLEDFVLDDCFRDWVLSRTSQYDGFWRNWIAHHPHMWHVIEEAKEIIRSLQHRPVHVSQEEIDRSFVEISDHFDRTVHNKSQWPNQVVMRAAAAALILILSVLGILYQNQPKEQIKQFITEQGVRKKVELPDGSRVYMKGNTQLSYFPVWERRRERRVELQGEAYFQVKEQLYQGRKIKFIVVTDDISIEVVGTEFIVNQTDQRTQVKLNSGKIRLRIKGERKPVSMVPGDVVEFYASNQKLVSKRKDPGPRSTWLKAFENSGAVSRRQSKDRENTGKHAGKKSPSAQQAASHSGSTQNAMQGPSDPGWPLIKGSKPQSAPGSQNQQTIVTSGQQAPKQGGNLQGNPQQYILQQDVGEGDQKSTNLGTILQQGDDNQAYIKQIGDNLKSKQTQSGDNNQAEAIFSGNNLKDEADDLEWSTHQLQLGQGNISFFRIIESYNTNIYSSQKGYENFVEVESQGQENKGVILQKGSYNEALILQEGSYNQAGIDPLTPGVLQQGEYNEIQIMQTGPGNSTQNIQQGSNNTIKVEQKGN